MTIAGAVYKNVDLRRCVLICTTENKKGVIELLRKRKHGYVSELMQKGPDEIKSMNWPMVCNIHFCLSSIL